MPPSAAFQTEQPDLFARSAEDLQAEMRLHGGGTPPRFPTPQIDEDDDDGYFSPVQYAEAIRAQERAVAGPPRTVRIRVVPIERLAELAG